MAVTITNIIKFIIPQLGIPLWVTYYWGFLLSNNNQRRVAGIRKLGFPKDADPLRAIYIAGGLEGVSNSYALIFCKMFIVFGRIRRPCVAGISACYQLSTILAFPALSPFPLLP